MATKKTDTVQIDFNLDKLDAPEEFRSHRFVFRGNRFETVDPSEIPYSDIEKVMETGQNRAVLDLFLGDQSEKFWELKPGLLHVKAFADELRPILDTIVGEPGESGDS